MESDSENERNSDTTRSRNSSVSSTDEGRVPDREEFQPETPQSVDSLRNRRPVPIPV
jgi:hypothetical protein